MKLKTLFTEINLRSKKWQISGSYNPKLNHIKNHLQGIGKGLEYYSSKYENFIVFGDFNVLFIISQTLLRNLHVTKT